MLDNNAQDKMEDEEPSLFHVLKMVKRRQRRVIRQILDMQGNNVSSHLNVLNTFVIYLRRICQPIETDQTCVTTLQGVVPFTCPTKYADLLEQPITIEKLLSVMGSGAKHKPPGIDGLAWSFTSLNVTL